MYIISLSHNPVVVVVALLDDNSLVTVYPLPLGTGFTIVKFISLPLIGTGCSLGLLDRPNKSSVFRVESYNIKVCKNKRRILSSRNQQF